MYSVILTTRTAPNTSGLSNVTKTFQTIEEANHAIFESLDIRAYKNIISQSLDVPYNSKDYEVTLDKRNNFARIIYRKDGTYREYSFTIEED